MKTIAGNDQMTLGMDKNHSETTHRIRWRSRRAALGLMATLLALPAMAQGGGAAPAVSAATTPTMPPMGTATTPAQVSAPTPRWGEGVLEREFLQKLRTFLETDPFDFKAFETAFGVPLEVSPPNGPHPDGSWGIGDIRLRHPFGMAYENRSRGGVKWNFSPKRDSAYVSMDFVKMPPAGKRDGDGLPCFTPELLKTVFADRWVGNTTYRDFSPVYPGRLPYPIPAHQSFRWHPDTPDEVWLSYPVDRTCVPALSVSTKRIPPHPATK